MELIDQQLRQLSNGTEILITKDTDLSWLCQRLKVLTIIKTQAELEAPVWQQINNHFK